MFFPLIIPSILNCIADSVAETPKKHLYQCLVVIIDTVPAAITQYQSMIFDTIESVVSRQSRADLLYVMDLLKRINQRSEESYLPQMNFVLPKVLQLIDAKRSADGIVTEQRELPTGSSLHPSTAEHSPVRGPSR